MGINTQLITTMQKIGALTLYATMLGTVAFADDVHEITIVFSDGEGITGTLIDYSDDKFTIDSTVGPVVIAASGVTCVGLACPKVTRTSAEDAAVTLESTDGLTTLSGELLGVVNDQYVVVTSAGEFRVDTRNVECQGQSCPDLLAPFVYGKPVTLSNVTSTIEGILIDTDSDAYVIENEAWGTLKVSFGHYDCSGPGCPES